MPKLEFAALPGTHKDFQPESAGQMDGLILKSLENPPVFIKKGLSRSIRTGVKLIVLEGHLLYVGTSNQHGDSQQVSHLQVFTPGQTSEIVLTVDSLKDMDRTVRVGEAVGLAWLIATGQKPKKESKE